MRIAVKRMRRHPDLTKELLRTRTTLRVVCIHFMYTHPFHHQLRHRHPGIETRKGILKHNLQLATQRKALRPTQANHRAAFVKNIPACRLEEAKQHHPNRALSRARLADQSQRRPAVNLETNVINSGEHFPLAKHPTALRELLDKVAYIQHRGCGTHCVTSTALGK